MLKDKKILYIGISSKFIHTNIAGWYLEEYLLSKQIKIESYYSNVNLPISENFDKISSFNADVILCSVYIFNVTYVVELFKKLKEKNKNLIIIVGGPEVDQNFDADYIILGEGEKALYTLLTANNPPKINYEDLECNLDNIPSPYTLERLGTLKNKLVYYESSRGCPFKCSYCMAGLTKGVRYFSLERVYEDLVRIVASGAKTVKFTDRTANENRERFDKLLKFIYDNFREKDVCFHFEIGVEILSAQNISLINKMPVGLIQCEIGVQTMNIDTQKAINRPFNMEKFDSKLKALLLGNVHIHLDLIFGLPKENLISFKESFNKVISYKPQQLQVGFLKFLKYAPIKDYPYNQQYEQTPPYEVISTEDVTIADKAEVKLVENAVDRLYNSQKFDYSLKNLSKKFTDEYSMYKGLGEYFKDYNFKLERDTLYKFYKFAGEDSISRDILKFDYLLSNNSRIIPEFMKTPYKYQQKNNDVNFYIAEFEYNYEGKADFRIIKFDYTKKDRVSGKYSFTILPTPSLDSDKLDI